MSNTAKIRQFIKQNENDLAKKELEKLIFNVFKQKVEEVKINNDGYSLNSVNGFATVGGQEYFFKFHQEEDEQENVSEYYNAKMLEDAGFPVEKPVKQSTQSGEQILFYDVKKCPRFADICLDYELGKYKDKNALLKAQADLDDTVLEIYKKTLKPPVSKDIINQQSINQLFYWRLVDSNNQWGARAKNFYDQQNFCFDNIIKPINFEVLKTLTWHINGVEYSGNLQQSFANATKFLNPMELAKQPVVTAHGDAHNANVWFNNNGI